MILTKSCTKILFRVKSFKYGGEGALNWDLVA